MAPDLQFDQGIMKLSSFDPQSKRMETRVLRLPDLPRLESLEHLFTAAAAVSAANSGNGPSSNNGSSRSRYAEVFAEPAVSTSLRLTKSFTSSSSSSSSKKSSRGVPRRCYSNPALSSRKNNKESGSGSNKKNSYLHVAHGTDMMMVTGESWKTTGCRRSSSRRSLSHAIHAFTGLLQKAKRSSTLRNKQQWHNETWFVEMRMSTEELERPLKKKRVGTHTENWWASSPPVCAC